MRLERVVRLGAPLREVREILGALDPDAPLPWDFIRQWQPRETLRRAYDVMMGRLAEG